VESSFERLEAAAHRPTTDAAREGKTGSPEIAREAQMIRIKPSHRGLLHKKLGMKPGGKIPLSSLLKAKHSSSAATRKEATFAVNARSWNKG